MIKTVSDKKSIDINGYWSYPNNPISKTGVFDYLGTEIGAPEPNKIYRVYRPEEELSRQDTIESFELMPLLNDHSFIVDGGIPEGGIHGAISNINYESPYLRADLMVYSKSLMELIKGGKVELSPSYRCQYVFESGVSVEGEEYDAIQTNLIGNHLALVDTGRTGPDVRVYDGVRRTSDSCPINSINNISDSNSDSLTKEVYMEFTTEQLAQIKSLIKEVLAENATDEEVKEESKDELTEVEQTEVVEQVEELLEEAVAQAEELVEEAVAQAEEIVEEIKEQTPALDAATVIKTINERNKLISRVVPFIGVFDSASMTTAQDVAVYTCSKLGIKSAKDQELNTLNGYLQGAKLDKVMDSKINNPRNSLSKLWSK